MATMVSTLVARLVDQISGPAKGAAGSLSKLAQAEKALANLEAQKGKAAALKTQLDQLAKTRKEFQAQRQAVLEMAQANAKAGTITKAMADKMESARTKLKTLARAMQDQKEAAIGIKRGLESAVGSVGSLASAEARLAANIARTTAALKQQQVQQARAKQRREALGTIGGAVAGYAAYKGLGYGLEAIQQAADFDIAVRKMRVYTDLKPGEDAGLLEQAKRIGQQTQFSNIDVIHAQATAMQGLGAGFAPALKAQIAEGILENVKNYSTLMDSNLAEGAETVRTYLATTRRDISTKEKALFEANKATNQIVKMAKLGGMSNEDVQGYLKFAMPSATAAGIDPEAALALGAVLRRGGYRGEEAGVAVRNFANKMVGPTSGGRVALTAAGLNYDKYVRPPTAMSTDNLLTHLGNALGTKATPKLREALAKIISDPKVMGNAADFKAAVADAVEGPAKAGKGGNSANRKKVAKAADKFYNVSASGIDVQRLLDDLIMSSMSLSQLNEFFSGKFGGKFAMTQQDRDGYIASRKAISEAGNDPEFAAKRATEVMAGLGGSLENLKGSFDNLILSMGQANEKWLKPAMDGIGNVVDSISNLSEPARQAATALGLVAAAIGLTKGTGAVIGGLFGKGGSADALMVSATALDSSAAALTRAAAVLGGESVVEGATSAAGGASDKGPRSRSRLSTTLGILAALPGLYEVYQSFQRGAKDYADKVAANGGRPPEIMGRGAVNWGGGRVRNPFAPGEPGVAPANIGASGSYQESPHTPYGSLLRDPSAHGDALAGPVQAAQQAGQQMQDALNVRAAPQVDLSSVNALIAQLERAKALLSSLAGMSIGGAAAPRAVPAPMTNPAYNHGN